MTLPHSLHSGLWLVALALASVFALSVISGCAGPYAMTKEPDRTTVTVTVEWSTPGRIVQLCGYGQRGGEVLGCYFDGRIIMGKPDGWGDERGLYILGHEVFHALGARH